MKYLKIFTIAVAALGLGACSNDDEPKWNTDGGVVVEMGQATLLTKEGKDLLTIPVTIDGERNGNVEVTFAIKSEYDNPAIGEDNIYLTTNTIVVFPEDNTYDLEVMIVDDDEMNKPRQCDITIVGVEGATIGAQNFTQVTIRDNDSAPYDRCAGRWILKAATLNDAGVLQYKDMYFNLEAYDEEDSTKYNRVYKVKNLPDKELTYLAYFDYDTIAKTGTVEFQYGKMAGPVEVASDVSVMVGLYSLTDEGYIVDRGSCFFDINSDFTQLTPLTYIEDGQYPEWAFLYQYNGYYYLYDDIFYATGMVRPAKTTK